MAETHTLHSALDHEPVDLNHGPAVRPEDLEQFQAGLLWPAAFGNGSDSQTALFKEKVASESVQEISQKKRKKESNFRCRFCPDTFTAVSRVVWLVADTD